MLRYGLVSNDQVEQAFGVLAATAQWLKSRGRKQRISETTLETYQSWQRDSANYAVWQADQIVGVFSLPFEDFLDWTEFDKSALWLRALATHPDFRGQAVGEFAVRSACQLAEGKPIYLDCVSDFLPGYYQNLGFQIVGRQIKKYPDGEYDITLMCFQEPENL